MENRKDIGKAIREQLDYLDKMPADALWSTIEKDLASKKRRRFILWFIPLSIGSTILFSMLFLGHAEDTKLVKPTHSIENQKNTVLEYKIKERTPNYKTKIVDSVKKKKLESLRLPLKNKNNNYGKNSAQPKITTLGQKATAETTSIKSKKTVQLIRQSRQLIRSTEEYDEYEITKKYKYIIHKKQVKTSSYKKRNLKKFKKERRPFKKLNIIEAKIAAEAKKAMVTGYDNQKDSIATILKDTIPKVALKKIPKKRKEMDSIYKRIPEKSSKFNVFLTPYYGCNYYGSIGKGNSLSNQYDNFNQKGFINTNYGIYVRVMLNDEIGLRAGFGKIFLKHSTLIEKTGKEFLDLRTIDLHLIKSENDIYNQFSNDSKVTITQSLNYYEMPLEAYYIWKNETFGIASSAGISFLFLKENELTLKSNSVSEQEIGKATNIKPNCFTGNFGMIFSYKLIKSIDLELSPALKYQFSGFDNVNPKPCILSIQASFSYKL